MKKKASSLLKYMILVLLFVFMTMYLANKNGYYAYNNYQKNVLTEEGIKRFEHDLKEGNAIDIDEYIEKSKDYSNNISRTTLRISNKVGHFIRKCLADFFEKITSNIE